jgi:PTH1 family peptidyl-tRNA hydrolase
MQQSAPFVIVGIGNPGKRYKMTRHNTGIMVVEQMAKKMRVKFKRVKEIGRIAKGQVNGKDIILVKPSTYVNLTGEIISHLEKLYPDSFNERFLVICDDVDLPLGQIKFRAKGSSGGHRGLLSIINAMQTEEFGRLRIGIGRKAGVSTEKYVLEEFSNEEQKILQKVLNFSCEALLLYIRDGMATAMNRFNRRLSDEEDV